MAWKVIPVDNLGTALTYGGDDTKKVHKYFSAYDLALESASDKVEIDTQTTFRTDKFRLKSPSTGFSYIFRTQDIIADRIISLPLMTTDGELSLAATGAENDWGNNLQTFRHQYLRLMNPDNTFGYLLNTSAITSNISITLPQLSSDDTFVFADATQTLANKTLSSPTIIAMTINTDSNTIKHSTTNNAGDLMVNTGTKYDRFARGTANQLPIVNPTGTGLTWIDKASLGGGSLGGDYQIPIVNNIIVGAWFGTSAAGASGCWDGFLTNTSTVTPTNISDTTGRIGLNYNTTADNDVAGFRTTDEYFTLQNDPELWVRYKYIANGQDAEYRVNIGFINDVTTSFATNTDLLANKSAFMWYKDDTDANTCLARNDGDAAQDNDTNTNLAGTDENIHTVRLWGESVNSRFGFSRDGAAAVYYTTEIPASTTRLGCVVQFMNDDDNARNFELYGAYFKAKVI